MSDYCFVVPVLPGRLESAQTFRKNYEENNPDHDRVYAAAGITEEQRWLQLTPMGDFTVVQIVTDDPLKAYNTLASSTDPWAVEFRKALLENNGFDMSKPAEINEQVMHWKAKEKMGV